MDHVALSLIVGAISFLAGAWRGWTACNRRWIDAANKGEPVDVEGEPFYVFTDSERWEPTQPPDSLSSE